MSDVIAQDTACIMPLKQPISSPPPTQTVPLPTVPTASALLPSSARLPVHAGRHPPLHSNYYNYLSDCQINKALFTRLDIERLIAMVVCVKQDIHIPSLMLCICVHQILMVQCLTKTYQLTLNKNFLSRSNS